jgi:glycerol-3-phosphate O-acyltransferase
VAELNKRLERPIQPFKLLRRQDMIQRVIYDPDVVRAVGVYAESNEVREDVAFEKARDYAREIVPSFSASAYYGIAIRLSRWVANKLFDVRLHRVDDEALKAIDPHATIVFVMNHRSNFDYVLVTYLAAEQSALSYAVGEWARIWPMSRLIRAMGAYFIRRRSRGALYRKVLSSYVQKATEAGVTQAVFPEGGLSRDGRIGEMKLGILSYVVEAWSPGGRDVVFVPVSLNYDRVVEDRILVAAGRTGQRRFRATIPEGAVFGLRYIKRRLTGKVGRFGMAAVVFGRPIALSTVATEDASGTVDRLAALLSESLHACLPITPVPVMLLCLTLREGRATLGEIVEDMEAERRKLPDGALSFVEDGMSAEEIRKALDVLVLRKFLTRDGETYSVVDWDVVSYYLNTIGPHLDAETLSRLPALTGHPETGKT